MNDVNTQRLNKRAEEIRKDLANAGDPSPFVTIVTWAAMTLFLALLALFTAPLGSFFGGSLLAVVGATHGLLATLLVYVPFMDFMLRK